MSVSLSPIGNSMIPFLNNVGLPLNAGQLYTYAAGTTTPQTTYTSNTGLVANSNPIILGTNGLAPNPIWLTDNVSYKFVLKDATGVTLETYDNINGQGTISGNLTVGGTLTANAITCTTNETIGGNLTVTGSITAGSFVGIGKTIKQIVSYSGNPGSFNSTAWVATSMSATITPSSTSSQILIITSFSALPLGGGYTGGVFTLYRDGTTTSATTYTVYGASTTLVVTGPGLYSGSVAPSTAGFMYLVEIV